jgi:hypothetical protein
MKTYNKKDDLQTLNELGEFFKYGELGRLLLLRRIILMQELRIQQLQSQISTIAQGVGLAGEPENTNNYEI